MNLLPVPDNSQPAKADPFADDFDDIYKWYLDPDKHKISAVQEKQLARWKFAREWYTNFEPVNDNEVVRALVRQFSVSERQAYNDVRACQRFFCTVDQVNEEFEKVLLIERTKRLRNKAIKAGTTKGLEIAAKCDNTLTKIHGFDREKALIPTPINVQVIINSDPATVGAAPTPNFESLKKSWYKLKDERAQALAQDIDFDDILDNPRNEQQHQRT